MRRTTTTATTTTTPLPVPQEAVLVLLPLPLAIHSLNQLNHHHHQELPTHHLITLTAILALLALPPTHHLQRALNRVPFTDNRGYRHQEHALILALALPLFLAITLLLHAHHQLHDPQQVATHHLMHFWNHSPNRIISNLLHYSPHDYLLVLTDARIDLLAFTILNLYSLLLDVSLASIAETYHCLPTTNNSARLIGSTIKSLLVATSFSIALHLGCWGTAITRSMSPFECLFSVFAFQSCLYLTTRLARRSFTLAESSIFSSTAVALMIEVIRLTSARLRYSAYLLQQQHPSKHPISDHERLDFLPRLFRFPTPAIAIQHVLVSGIFLMAFTLAPLLVLSRRLGQRPTKRTKPSHRSLSLHRTKSSPTRHALHLQQQQQQQQQIQKPIWTSEPAQPDYYQRFSNPDAQHYSRQHENAHKENLRKIVALSIYASITWIGLVVMSHWLGWLFEIGRDRRVQETWWRRILGPGWLGFFYYCFMRPPLDDGSSPMGAGIVGEEGEAGRPMGIRWARIGMLLYWWICLLFGIGGWTTYLVRKRRSLRDPSHRERGRLAGWRSCIWKGAWWGARSRSRVRSSSPLTISLAMQHTPTMTTLASSLSFLAGAMITRRTPTTPPSVSELVPRPASPQQPQPSNPSVPHPSPTIPTCSPSDLMGKINLLVRRAFMAPAAPPASRGAQEPRRPCTPPSMSFPPAPSPLPPSPHSLTSSSAGASFALPLPNPPASLLLVSSLKKEQLNLKRKFFHLLVCLMFLPTIPIDIEFSSISFSVAFVIFTFCEFARYFAFYPIGAAIHLFFNEFIDSKDSGPVILSHFYLLTACSTGIWLDGLPLTTTKGGSVGGGLIGWMEGFLGEGGTSSSSSSWRGCRIEDLIGVIILGVGDSCASVVGKRLGKIKWSVGSPKTVEGSLAFVASVILVSFLLRLVGLVQPFPVVKFAVAVILISLLEAFTNQNDNLVLPLYSWSMLKLLFLYS